ncbi:MAG: hypothetical protein E6Q95_04945 [Chitinophagaceae bacterium]|nr:MAG: hypothetical protein E6Q95_04945 [Chitinophagaceae bacterium]
MGNIFNQDFIDFLEAFNQFKVRYILVGGFSVILHGYSRTTGDMDIWVERTAENYINIQKAFAHFGMSVFDMTEQNFLYHPVWDVYTFGTPPSAIDIMMSVKGLNFEQCFQQAIIFETDGLSIRTLHFNNLIEAKKASGRLKDLDDINNLTFESEK